MMDRSAELPRFRPSMISTQQQIDRIDPARARERRRGFAPFVRCMGRPRGIDLLEISTMPLPSEVGLRELFDLTPAETRFARAMAGGGTLEEVAASLNIKMTTARTHLRAIFCKTDTSRQAQLVVVLSRIAHLGC